MQITPERPTAKVVPEKSIEAELDKLIMLGRIERTVKVAGLDVTMHSLADEEKEMATKGSAGVLSFTDFDDPKKMMEKLEAVQKPILVEAITQIDTQRFTEANEKAALTMLLSKMQSTVVMMLFVEYVKILGDQYVLLSEGVKKN